MKILSLPLIFIFLTSCASTDYYGRPILTNPDGGDSAASLMDFKKDPSQEDVFYVKFIISNSGKWNMPGPVEAKIDFNRIMKKLVNDNGYNGWVVINHWVDTGENPFDLVSDTFELKFVHSDEEWQKWQDIYNK